MGLSSQNPSQTVTLGPSTVLIGAAQLEDAITSDKARVAAGPSSSSDVGLFVHVGSSQLPTGAATQATLAALNTFVQLGTQSVDVSDRSSRLLGHVTVDNFPALSSVDVSDRVGRLLGHVAVDSSALPSGAATEATLSTVSSSVSTVASAVHQEDAAALSGDYGIAALSMRNDARAITTSTDGDYTMAAVDSVGRRLTVVDSSTLPTGAATEATLGAINTKLAGTIAVSGPLTDAQLRASAVAISAASLPLPTGAATQTTLAAISTQLSGTIAVNQNNISTGDFDTTTGTVVGTMMGIALPGSGGPVIGGTATNPVRTDPTGSTTQPISAVSLPLPTGAATAAKQAALGVAGTASADVITVQGVAGMTALKVDGSGITQPVSGTVTANAGTNLNTSLLALEAGGNLATIAAAVHAEDAASADADKGVAVLAIRKATPANTSGTDGDYEALQINSGRVWTSTVVDTALPAGSNAIGKLAANDGVDVGDVTVNNAAGASAVNIQDGGNSITVDGAVTANAGTNLNTSLLATEAGNLATIAAATHLEDAAAVSGDRLMSAGFVRNDTNADQTNTDGDYTVPVTDAKGNVKTVSQAGTSTLANVAGSASSVTLVAANNNRKSFVIFNDSAATLHVKEGSTASATSFTYQLDPFATLESPENCPTVILTGIWTAATGNARTTERT